MAGDLADAFADEVLAGFQVAGVAEAVEQQEVAHHDAGKDLGQGAGRVFEAFAGAAFDGSHLIEALVAFGGLAQDIEAVLPGGEIRVSGFAGGSRSQRLGDAGLVAFDLLEIGAVGDAFHGCHNLQLARSFVDREDAGIAIQAFAGVFLHKAASAVDLDAVVGATVGELAGAEFHQRREDVGDAGCGTRRGRKVNVTGGLIQQAPGAVGTGTHPGQDVLDSHELVDGMAELLAGSGVCLGFAAGGLAQTDRLGTDAQTGAVHQRHHVFDQTQAAFAHDLGRGVGELQFAGRRALDAHLVLDAAHHHTAVGTVEHEVRQAAAVGRTFLAAGQHQVQVGVTVGDEALHTVQAPAAGCLVVGSLQAHRLQVAACVGFREVHRAGGTLADAGQILVFQCVGAEFLDGVGAVGQAPDRGEAHIGAGDDLGGHHHGRTRPVETVVFAVERNAVEARLDQGVEVPTGAGRIRDAAVLELRTFVVHLLGVGRNHLSGDLTHQVHHHIVLRNSLFGGSGGFRVLSSFGIILFLDGNHALHFRMVEVEGKALVIGIEIHNYFRLFL